jgi:GNAT superfamily N-acetyltransferase
MDWRRTRSADASAVVGTLAAAFAGDPVWGTWACGDAPDRVGLLEVFWKPWVDAGLKYDGFRMAPDASVVSGWVPPGVHETDDEDEAAIEAVTLRLFAERAALLLEAYGLFEANRPAEPHWYLSLLATHPAHRGQGLGMRMVADLLEPIDAAHQPTYLESTNPANDARYESVGFLRHGSFTLPEGPTVTTMWRPAR